MRGVFKTILAAFIAVGGWLWTGATILMNWIGRSTLYEDTETALSLGERGLNWLFSTPWWGPGLSAAAATIFLFCVFWPRKPDNVLMLPAEPRASTPAQSNHDFKIDPWAGDIETFIEIEIDLENWRATWEGSNNIYDCAVDLRDKKTGQIDVLVVFDKWVASHKISITCDKKQKNYRTAVVKRTDRYVTFKIVNCMLPCKIRVDF